MPGDPRECRQHALTCVQLVQTAATQQARENFAKLARTWIRLAGELEQSHAFLAGVKEDEEPELVAELTQDSEKL